MASFGVVTVVVIVVVATTNLTARDQFTFVNVILDATVFPYNFAAQFHAARFAIFALGLCSIFFLLSR